VSAPYLEISGLKKSFGLKPVLRGIDLSLDAGKRMALLGANGAGKTTLLRILAGVTKASAGSVHIGGLEMRYAAQQIQRRVGFVAHSPYLYDELTALENLLFYGRMYGVSSPTERATALLERVGLARKARERAGTLSRGQAQRLALARALLHTPELLLLDEPDTGLDAEGNELLATLLAEHSEQGGTLVFATHHIESALEQSDYVVMLSKGRVAYAQEIASTEPAGVRQAYLEVVR
jgi:heme exporter protein A